MENNIVSVARLMEQSGVKFGTSGARGPVAAMSDLVCYVYTSAFLAYLARNAAIEPGSQVALAGDYRSSSPRIMSAAARAISDQGYRPLNCGSIPTPALTCYAMQHAMPSLMVTGSHIPDDRNGIKFNKPDGEILKKDEQGIRAERVELPPQLFTADGGRRSTWALPGVDSAAYAAYRERYLAFFPPACLEGLRVGVYQHSSVARKIMLDLLLALGAEAVPLGRSERFVPVDTEAIRPEDIALAREWSAAHGLDALVSTDGDGDRPLIADERGRWLRGDVAGVLCARYLGVQHLATPVSSNSLVEKSGWFQQVERTRIGSPYVIAAMQAMLESGCQQVAGYEANGGFLIADTLQHPPGGGRLAALPTRDAVIVLLAILHFSVEKDEPVSRLLEWLPRRFTSSGRLQAIPAELSGEWLSRLSPGDGQGDFTAMEAVFGDTFGAVAQVDQTDGLRMTFDSDEVVHLRPSGNAPELRVYNEAGSPERALELNEICLQLLETWRGQ